MRRFMVALWWVAWVDNRRLLGPIANIPPAKADENFYTHRDVFDRVA